MHYLYGRHASALGDAMASRLGALALTGAVLLPSACGARWDDDQRAAMRARGNRLAVSAGTRGTAPDATTPAGGPAEAGGGTTDAALPGSPAGDTGAAAAPEAGAQPAEPAQPGAASAPGERPCAAPSTEIGVTAREIVLGEISSLSGPVPGLGASSAAAVRAYVAQRNATGGVCGRRLVLREADDGTDAGRYRAALRDLGGKVLAVTGGFAVGDIGSEDVINELGIPIINSPTGRTGELRLVFDINPDFPRPDMLIGKYKYLYEQGARRVSMTYIAVDQSRIEANIQRRLMEAAGLQVVHVNELPLSTLSYDAAAREAANSGAN